MLILNDWVMTFVRILIRPRADTFREEAQKAQGKFWSAMAWLVLVVLVIHVYFILAAYIFYPIGIILLTIILFPFGILLFVLGLHRLTQKWFQVEEDHYFEILYLTTAAIVPCFLLNFVARLIPVVGGVLSYVVIFYPLILVSLAIKALMPLTVWQVLVVTLVSLLFAVAGMFVIPYFLAGVISNLGVVLPV